MSVTIDATDFAGALGLDPARPHEQRIDFYDNNNKWLAIYAAIAAFLLLVGLGLFFSNGTAFERVASLCLLTTGMGMGLTSYQRYQNARQGVPSLVLDAQRGVKSANFGRFFIPWTEIERVSVTGSKFNPMVTLALKDSSRYRFGLWQRLVVALIPGRVYLNTTFIAVDRYALTNLIAQQLCAGDVAAPQVRTTADEGKDKIGGLMASANAFFHRIQQQQPAPLTQRLFNRSGALRAVPFGPSHSLMYFGFALIAVALFSVVGDLVAGGLSGDDVAAKTASAQLVQKDFTSSGAFNAVDQEVLWSARKGDEVGYIVRTEFDAQNSVGASLQDCYYTFFVLKGPQIITNPTRNTQRCDRGEHLADNWQDIKTKMVTVLLGKSGLDRFEKVGSESIMDVRTNS